MAELNSSELKAFFLKFLIDDGAGGYKLKTDSAGGAVTAPVLRTPAILRTSAAGNVAAGKKSVSIYVSGAADGVLLGGVVKPGEQFNYDGGGNDTVDTISYDATGTEFVITSLT